MSPHCRRLPARSARLLLLLSLATVVAAADEVGIRRGHDVLEERGTSRALAIGDRAPALRFRDVDGKPHHVDGEATVSSGPAVLVFLSTTCPLAARYTERLKRLAAAFSSGGTRFFGVFPNEDETFDGVVAYRDKAAYPFAIVRDATGHLARQLGATMTPQAFVIDGDGKLRYRGAIDDHRYGDRVKERYLADALEAVASRKPVAREETPALGCSIHLAAAPAEGEINYARHVARILQENCQECHRQGQVAPFALTSYEEAERWKTEIRAYTTARLMPPWKAAPGYGDFLNDFSLSDAEIGTIAAWVDGGAPEGDPRETPPPPVFNDGWAYGEPDLVIEMPEEYVVGPEGEDDYRHFIVPIELEDHSFVEAVDVRPGNRKVVHHVLVYVDTSGKARELDAEDPGPGYSRFGGVGFDPASVLGGWAPGNAPIKSPPGSGNWFPKKCDVVLQVHYYRTGFEERDRTRVGVYLSKSPRPVPVRGGIAINHDFEVPPGEKRYEVRASCEVKEPVWAFDVTPHMHLIGREMKVTAHLPDGSTLPFVWVKDWDFNWQTTYRFREMQFLPAGTRVDLVAYFDNSSENPDNPHDPPAPIGWGEKTTDEMCIAFLSWLNDAEYDPQTGGRKAAVE